MLLTTADRSIALIASPLSPPPASPRAARPGGLPPPPRSERAEIGAGVTPVLFDALALAAHHLFGLRHGQRREAGRTRVVNDELGGRSARLPAPPAGGVRVVPGQ